MTFPLKKRLSLAAKILLGKEKKDTSKRSIPPISIEDIEEINQFFPMKKFFIFGHARSGTTVLARLVRLHPQVHCNYQAHFFTRSPLLQSLVSSPEVGEWLQRGSNRWNRGVDPSPVIMRIAADYMMEREARKLGKTIVGDKSPNSLLDGQAVHFMHQVYPDGRLIYIVRDGRDTALSHRFQAFIDFPNQLSKEDLEIRQAFAKHPEPYLSGEKSVFSEKALLRAAQGWVRNINETHQTGQALFNDRYYSLRYEDLLNQPWEQMRLLWEFLGADLQPEQLEKAVSEEMQKNPDAQWQQEKAREIAEPLQKGKQGNWREIFTLKDREIFDQIAGETLIAWGYGETRSAKEAEFQS
jgi:hypothetical protein